VPPDPNEPVTGVVQTLTVPSDRSNALALMTRARLKLQLHAQRTPSFVISETLSSSSGAGSMTETWMNGQKWRWSGTVGNDSAVRIAGDGLTYGQPQGGAIPPAVHVLRNAIFWAATSGVPDAEGSIRSSSAIWNRKPTTCLLFGPRGEDPQGARTWDRTGILHRRYFGAAAGAFFRARYLRPIHVHLDALSWQVAGQRNYHFRGQ
jgi:hypothetical protein